MNLTEIVIRSTDTLDDLVEKAEVATVIGTMQASLTDFRYLRKLWQKNTEEEALLGVSMTGIMDHPIMNGEGIVEEIDFMDRTVTEVPAKYGMLQSWLTELKEVCIETNKQWASKLGINVSCAITCVN